MVYFGYGNFQLQRINNLLIVYELSKDSTGDSMWPFETMRQNVAI